MDNETKTWIVTAATSGRASCVVAAETKEDALTKALSEGEWEHDEWDINTQSHKGGFIEAVEE